MNFQQFATSDIGTRLWVALARALPPSGGHAFARLLTAQLSRRVGSSLYRALYANQSVVLGPAASPADVHRATRAVLRHGGRVSYDLMHLVAAGESAIRASVTMGPAAWADIEAARAGGHGVMVCGSHLSNFNLGLLAFAAHGLPMQILSSAREGGGFKVVGRLRSRGMLDDTPLSAGALKAALQRLRGGGMVLTGIDWPEGSAPAAGELRGQEPVSFFGRPAHLPTGHVRLALASGARLLPVSMRWEPGRGYHVLTAPPFEVVYCSQRAQTVLHNARRVLAVLEGWIGERPEQWLMYHPVWERIPDATF
jgi:phosphatidylinositol dimannoside acyltransferase